MEPSSSSGVKNSWDTADYDGEHSFVYEYGEDVVDLLDPREDERILDLGCGTGHLTNQIAERAGEVVGLDQSEEMVAQARTTYPSRTFICADAREFTPTEPFDAVFSNAMLHWVREQETLITTISEALRPNGRFVAECGGAGNVRAIINAVNAELEDRGYDAQQPWYFPSVADYATRLEAHGFEVRYATLFDRPTELDGGDNGLAEWLRMFGDSLLSSLSDAEQREVITSVEESLQPEYFHNGSWTADYRRLRFVAVRV